MKKGKASKNSSKEPNNTKIKKGPPKKTKKTAKSSSKTVTRKKSTKESRVEKKKKSTIAKRIVSEKERATPETRKRVPSRMKETKEKKMITKKTIPPETIKASKEKEKKEIKKKVKVTPKKIKSKVKEKAKPRVKITKTIKAKKREKEHVKEPKKKIAAKSEVKPRKRVLKTGRGPEVAELTQPEKVLPKKKEKIKKGAVLKPSKPKAELKEVSKYIEPVPPLFKEEFLFLPTREQPPEYGENSITLIIVDPVKIFTFWEVREDTLKIFKGKLNIRVYDVTDVDLERTEANSFFDIPIEERIGRKYIDVNPMREFIADIGIIYEGIFITVARSNRVSTPQQPVLEEGFLVPTVIEKDVPIGY